MFKKKFKMDKIFEIYNSFKTGSIHQSGEQLFRKPADALCRHFSPRYVNIHLAKIHLCAYIFQATLIKSLIAIVGHEKNKNWAKINS